jgi:hypothetical protein
LIGVTNSARNEVRLGGGDPLSHAATSIGFYTASALSTVNGTEWMQINGSGLVSIGTQPGVYTTSRVSIFGTDAGLALSLTNATADNIGGYRLASANNAVATGSTAGSMVLYSPANTSLEIATATSGTRIVRARIKPSGVLQLVPATTQTYATDALAVTGGLVAGDTYQTANGLLRIVGSAVTEPGGITDTWTGNIIAPEKLGTGSSITTKYLRGDGTWQTISGGGDALTSSNLDQFADVTQTSGQTLAITASTTLNGGTHSGTNTGDQDLSGYVQDSDVDTSNTPSKIVARDGAGVINVGLMNATGGQSVLASTLTTGVTEYGNSATWTYGTGRAAAHREALQVFETIGIACSDMTTVLTTGEKIAFDMPFDFSARRVYASLAVAPTVSALTLDVEDEGTSILNAVLSISTSANNAETSTFASAASSYALSKGDRVTVDIDSVGSSNAGLIVFIEGYRT